MSQRDEVEKSVEIEGTRGISANAFDLEPYFKHLGFERFEPEGLTELELEDFDKAYTFHGNPFDASADAAWDFEILTYTRPSGTGGGHDFLVDIEAISLTELPETTVIRLSNVTIEFNLEPSVVLDQIVRILKYLVKCLEMPYT